jgi:hypothetical protein
MREKTQTQRGTRRAAPIVVLAATLLLASAALGADESPVSPQGESCPAGVGSPDVNGQAQELMRSVAQQDLQPGQNPEGDPDTVVLNNRGYNYGPPPGVRFDPIVERPPADPHAQ